jgi:hypothetical protein
MTKTTRRSLQLLVCLTLACLTPWIRSRLRVETLEIRQIKRDAARGLEVSDISPSLLKHISEDDFPLADLHSLAEHLVRDTEGQSDTLEELRRTHAAVPLSRFDGWPVPGFGIALSYLRILGLEREELTVLTAATRLRDKDARIGPEEIARYVDRAYLRVAMAYFSDDQYSEGLRAVRDGLVRMRLLSVPPLTGEIESNRVISSLLILDAFLPELSSSREDLELFLDVAMAVTDDSFSLKEDGATAMTRRTRRSSPG